MKTLINSDMMSWFRKSFLTKIKKDILEGKNRYCCLVESWHTYFICWKDLKEVKENLDSEYIISFIKNYNLLNSSEVWFNTNRDRLDFLDQCLAKFK